MINKTNEAYKTISEVAELLNLINTKTGKVSTHTIRFWEKEFKQIKPIFLNGKRRYYDEKNIKLLKKIHYLLKVQGMTISGAKKILTNQDPLKLDEISNHSIKAVNLKKKLSKISNLIKNLKYKK